MKLLTNKTKFMKLLTLGLFLTLGAGCGGTTAAPVKKDSEDPSKPLATINDVPTINKTIPQVTDGLPVAKTDKVSIVYFTRDLSAKGLQKIYDHVNKEMTGKVAIKLHTGEKHGPNILPRDWVQSLQKTIPNSTIVETNTLYRGDRYTTEGHKETLQVNGWTFCPVDIMDEHGTATIPVKGGHHLKTLSVGKSMLNYDSMLVLTHFKGHAMGGFGGSIKNIAIGCADGRIGKAEVHGQSNPDAPWDKWPAKERLMENMVESAKATCDHFGKHITFINVLRNMSVDCDCAGVTAAKPTIPDIGIFGSLDIEAVDQASIDAVFTLPGSDNHDLKERIESRKGLRQLSYGEEIGLGNRHYKIVDLDKE